MKKGQNYYLISAVIMVLFLLVTFPLYGSFKSKNDEVISHQTCAESVRLNGGLKLSEGEYANAIKCPTVCENRPERNKEDAMSLLSNRMVLTWKEFQRGQPNLFEDALFEQNSYCIVRFIETFENGDKIGTITGEDFANHLRAERVVYDNQEYALIEFLTGHDSQELDTINLAKFKSVPIDPTVPQSIIVLYTKETELTSKFTSWTGYAAGAGLIIGTILTGGVGTVAILGTVAFGSAGGAFAFQSGQGSQSNHDAAIMLVPWTTDVLEKFGCEYLPADPGDTEVC